MKKFNCYLLKKKSKSIKKEDGSIVYVTFLDSVYREIEIMKEINNPYIVKLHKIIKNEEKDKLYLGFQFLTREFWSIVN